MGRAQLQADSGQTQAEYAIVVAAIAVACIVAVLFFGGTVRGLFDSSTQPLVPGSGTFTPPAPTTELPYPSSADQCANNGWTSFPQFTSEEECVTYVDSLAPSP